MKKAFFFFLAINFYSYAANLAPEVNAGDDLTDVGTKDQTYLQGSVSDDSTLVDSMSIDWTQIAGPSQAQIINANKLLTRVVFPEAGTYEFELQASDGELSGADSVLVVVRESLPFKVLSPADGEHVLIGSTYIIRWQMDPSKPCNVWYSLDSGISYSKLNDQGSISDSFEWFIDSSFIDSARQGIMKVEEYQNQANYTTSAFTFVERIDTSDGNSEQDSGCGNGGLLAIIPCAGLRFLRKRQRNK